MTLLKSCWLAVLFLATSTLARAAVFDTALVHYQFTQEQLDANLFVDLRGNVNLARSGTSGSFPTIVAGPENAGGEAVEFISNRTLATVPGVDDSLLNITSSMNSEFSLSAWIRRPLNGEDFIISKMDSADAFRGWWINVEDGGQISTIFRNTNVAAERIWYRTTDPVMPDGDPDFHHVAVTYDFETSAIDANRGVKIYVDGVLQPLTKDPNSSGNNFDAIDFDLSSSSPFTINGRNGVGTLGTNGTIAELAIWDTALSAQDVASLAGLSFPGDFNGDFVVDGSDFLVWQRGNSPNPLSATDLAQWKTNFGSSAAAASATAVPEPSALILAGLSMAACGMRRASCPTLRFLRWGPGDHQGG